jgi:hypothetical protein
MLRLMIAALQRLELDLARAVVQAWDAIVYGCGQRAHRLFSYAVLTVDARMLWASEGFEQAKAAVFSREHFSVTGRTVAYITPRLNERVGILWEIGVF